MVVKKKIGFGMQKVSDIKACFYITYFLYSKTYSFLYEHLNSITTYKPTQII